MKSSCSNKERTIARCKGGWLFFAALLVLAAPPHAFGQVIITEVTPLQFGKIVIRDRNAVGRVTIDPGGTYSHNSNIWLHENPSRGEYLLESDHGETMYTITFPPSVSLTGPGGTFILDELASSPSVLITNSEGNDTFYISGRLQTQGGGAHYGDGNYSQTFFITLNF